MQPELEIAKISVDPRTKAQIQVSLTSRRLRFKCQRCAVFCCRLGGPRLGITDVERLKQSKANPRIFLNVEKASMKNRENGSCIFLSFDRKEDQHYCSVYNHRPALCRLFPFEFEKSGPKSYTLGYIPCCNGLNKDDGEQVDEKFFARNLLNTFLELMNSKTI